MSWRNRSRTQKYKQNSGKPVFYGRYSYRSSYYKTQFENAKAILKGVLKCLVDVYTYLGQNKEDIAIALIKQKIYELETFLNSIEYKREKKEEKEERKNGNNNNKGN